MLVHYLREDPSENPLFRTYRSKIKTFRLNQAEHNETKADVLALVPVTVDKEHRVALVLLPQQPIRENALISH